MSPSTTVVLAVVGVALLVAAGFFAVFTLGGSGARPPGPGAAAATEAGSSSVPPAAAAAATATSPAPRPAASHHDPLGSAAASYVSTRDGVVLAAVYDLRTGQTWQFGQGQPQDEASVVKLDVLETLLAERGRSGTELSADDRTLAEEMIEDSDNDAATSLWDEVGGASGIRSFNTSAGLADTVPSACVNCPGFPWPGWGLTTTIPGDQLTLLRTLVEPNSLLTNTDRSYALSLMENVTPDQRWGVTGGVPAQATVALKNGWLPLNSANNNWQINSVGWISGSGRDYLIAVLTTGNPTEQYGIDTIDQLAAMVWNGMA
ncbi:MAG: serine hydrolase [Streptosporangiaceae bacterium]